MAVEKRQITIKADDGYVLAAILHVPPSGAPAAPLTVIASATGVPQGYYGRFATYLAETGRPALTFDGRGIARSAPKSLKGFPARFRDWGILDFPGVIDWATAEYPNRPLDWVGHSYGGFGLGLARNNARVDKLLGISTMSADVQLLDNKWAGWQIGMMLFALGPAAAHTMGYAPGVLFGGTDLPKNVVLEWSKWCRTPGFLFGVDDLPERRHFDSVRAAVRLTRMTDDTWLGHKGVEHLLSHFTNARAGEIKVVTPADAGNKPIGHLGFFRSDFRDTLWRDACAWLDG